MEETFAQLLDDFVDDALLLVEGVARASLDLEQAWLDGSHDPGALQRLKNDLHTLKGNAAMMGLAGLEGVTHALEDLCDRLAGDAASSASVKILFDGGDLLEKMVRAAADEARYGGVAADFVARVAAFVDADGAIDSPLQDPAAAPYEQLDPEAAKRRALADSIRIRFSRIDDMLELVGEATLVEGALTRSSQQLLRTLGNVPEAEQVDQSTATLRKLLKQLQAKLLEARLLPFSSVFERLRRCVSDLARDHQRPIQLVTEGGDTLVDKAIIDRLGEPLLHLARNAVAHGLEPVEARIAAGKPGLGTILLTARQVGNQLVINLGDDGRGLDLAAILAKARALGQDPARLTPDDIPRLIFTHGLSTAAEVSALAGRGVGLDIVAASMRTLGASIDVRSTPGLGTVFDLTLPLTLSMTKGLLVCVDGETFVIPTSHVAEGLRLEEGSLHEIHRLGVLSWRGNLIHVSDCGALLGTARGADTARRHCVVLAAGTRRRGLLVDKLLGYREILIKPLDPLLSAPGEVSGATLLADGSVAMILDAAHILEQRILAPRPEAPAAFEPKRH